MIVRRFYAGLGETKRALDLLGRFIPVANDLNRAWIKHDSDFDSLRSHPHFQKKNSSKSINLSRELKIASKARRFSDKGRHFFPPSETVVPPQGKPCNLKSCSS
jgi:hypothetical protein